jgi:hypothetical protein
MYATHIILQSYDVTTVLLYAFLNKEKEEKEGNYLDEVMLSV